MARRRKLIAVIGTAEEPRIQWPWGTRASVGRGKVDALPDDAPVDYWVCCRLDEPETWVVRTNQFRDVCCACGGGIIFRKSAKSPTNPGVKKICRRCAERLVNEG